MRIREATADDVAFLTDVVVTATRAQGRLADDFDEEAYRRGFVHWTHRQLDGEIPGSTTSVIEIDGERAGRLRVIRDGATVDLAGLQLLPAFQSRGVGSAIIADLKAEAAAAGLPMTIVVEEDNPRAAALYHRLGFVYTHDRDGGRALYWEGTAWRHQVITDDDVPLSVHVDGTTGTTETIIQLSGGPGCVNYLAGLGAGAPVRVLSPDPRGVGASGGGPHDTDRALADLETIRRWFGVDRWTVVGHSYGANLAVLYALRHPEAVRDVVAVCGTGFQNDRSWHAAYTARKAEQPPPDIEWDRRVHRRLLDDWRRIIRLPRLYRDLARLETPIRLVAAADDIRPSWPLAQLAELLPNGRFDVIPGVPHDFWHSHSREWGALLGVPSAPPVIPTQRRPDERMPIVDGMAL